MKFSKVSQLFLVSSLGLIVATLLTACQLVTIDYLYLASAGSGTGDGQIQTFAVDSQSGALRTGPPAVSSGGVNPVALAISPNEIDLYVANAGDNSVVHFKADYNGNLSKQDAITLAAPPTSLAVNQAGNYLYVLFGSTTATLNEYALSSSGAIGAVTSQQSLVLPGYTGDPLVPTGLVSTAYNKQVYVTAYDQAAYNPGGPVTSTANPGWVFGFAVGSGGSLTPTLGSPYKAGVKPSAITADPTSRFTYITDYASNQLIGYGIQSSGQLTFLINGPFRTGAEPTSVAIDPRGLYMYVSNALDSSVSAYVIDLKTGTPAAAINPTGSAANATDTQPVWIAVDPALGRFVYTANYLGNSVSGFQLDPNAGTLKQSQSTPYPADLHPTALAMAAHGNHSTQSVTP
ncbi:MAG: beta-propeller fold lactonase family protein [Terracidiphilus sp.]